MLLYDRPSPVQAIHRFGQSYLLAITETYFKAPGDDIYANGPVSYLRIGDLPDDDAHPARRTIARRPALQQPI